VQDVSLQPPADAREDQLLGNLSARTLAIVARELKDPNPRTRPVGVAQRSGSPPRRYDCQSNVVSGLPERRSEGAKVRLRPARDAGIEKQRIEYDVSGTHSGSRW
jgi:hypothetical protein